MNNSAQALPSRSDGADAVGRDLFRLENLSDAVFGFALTLLVVSVEVPATFDELAENLRGFLAFALAFAMLILIWHEHGRYFRRYAVRDAHTIVLNALLLFVVLFYVYPLKFLATVFVKVGFAVTGIDAEASMRIREMLALRQLPTLFLVYSVGLVAVFLVFALLYRHAWKRADALGLTRHDRFDARVWMQYHLIFVAVGLISVLMAIFEVGLRVGAPGWVYLLLGPLHYAHGRAMQRRRERLPKA